jgi:hypothetical protein
MSNFYDFGRFSEISEEKIKKDKELFSAIFENICLLAKCPLELKEGQNNEKYLNNIFQKGIKRIDFPYFMTPFGISYDYLNKEEKEEFKKLFISYENVKKFTLNFQKKYIEKCQNSLPTDIRECFEDICFIIYCHIYGNPKIDAKIFIRNIRDYFILDKKKNIFEIFRKKDLFDKIKSKMLKLYPRLKKEYYGMNTTIEYLLSYIDGDNDYNYKILRDILDKKKGDECEDEDDERFKLKEKKD